MTYYLVKIAVTTGLIVIISEVAKRSSLIGAILASIPLVSVLAMLWLYIDTKDAAKISALSTNIFWLVLPSLTLFLSLPILLRHGINFYLSMFLSVGAMFLCYLVLLALLNNFGIKL